MEGRGALSLHERAAGTLRIAAPRPGQGRRLALGGASGPRSGREKGKNGVDRAGEGRTLGES